MKEINKFKLDFGNYIEEIKNDLQTSDGEWIVKGFIDVFKNIYTISIDTKVVSKIIELMIIPKLIRFADLYGYDIELAEHQNHYPDLTFINRSTKSKIAVDIKSTYKKTNDTVNGMTLGAFTGYFRNRDSLKNITYPYNDYTEHFVLGILYTQIKTSNIESKTFTINEVDSIQSVVRDFDFFIQEKWRIASDKIGSGNTKNIGSCKNIKDLINGSGIFTEYKNGKEIFNDYWKFYLTNKMAKESELDEPPYNNLETYLKYKQLKPEK